MLSMMELESTGVAIRMRGTTGNPPLRMNALLNSCLLLFTDLY